jgi:hypothetical protein
MEEKVNLLKDTLRTLIKILKILKERLQRV